MLYLKNYKFDTYETLTYIFKRLVLFKNDIDFILLAPSNRNDTNFSAELVFSFSYAILMFLIIIFKSI